MDSKKCACQWYERDLSVMVGVDGYNKSAGFGWKKIEGATSNTLILNAADIIYQQKYKLVVVYNNNITLTAETELWNHNASYSYAIEQITDGADVCSVCALRASRRGRAMWQMPVLFAAPVKQSPGFVLRISDIQEGE